MDQGVIQAFKAHCINKNFNMLHNAVLQEEVTMDASIQWQIKGGGDLGAAVMGPCQKGAHEVCQTASQISEFILEFSIQLSK